MARGLQEEAMAGWMQRRLGKFFSRMRLRGGCGQGVQEAADGLEPLRICVQGGARQKVDTDFLFGCDGRGVDGCGAGCILRQSGRGDDELGHLQGRKHAGNIKSIAKDEPHGEYVDMLLAFDLARQGWLGIFEDDSGDAGRLLRHGNCHGCAELRTIEKDAVGRDVAHAGKVSKGGGTVCVRFLLGRMARLAGSKAAIVEGEDIDAERMERLQGGDIPRQV